MAAGLVILEELGVQEGLQSAEEKKECKKAREESDPCWRKKAKAYSTWYSQAVSHPSTNQARPCLASEIRRDRAYSGWCGRRQYSGSPSTFLYLSPAPWPRLSITLLHSAVLFHKQRHTLVSPLSPLSLSLALLNPCLMLLCSLFNLFLPAPSQTHSQPGLQGSSLASPGLTLIKPKADRAQHHRSSRAQAS